MPRFTILFLLCSTQMVIRCRVGQRDWQSRIFNRLDISSLTYWRLRICCGSPRLVGLLKSGITLLLFLLCLVDLKGRSERDDLDDWLCFAPHREGEEALLDSVIDCLVKPRLARVDADSVGPSEYIYHLYPDWAAIASRLRNMAAAEELVGWIEEQV